MLHPATVTASTCYPLPHRPPYGSRRPLPAPLPTRPGEEPAYTLDTEHTHEQTPRKHTITLYNYTTERMIENLYRARGSSGRVRPWVETLRAL